MRYIRVLLLNLETERVCRYGKFSNVVPDENLSINKGSYLIFRNSLHLYIMNSILMMI